MRRCVLRGRLERQRLSPLEIHLDAINDNDTVLIVDDLLATGGTAAATCRLVENLGGNIVGLSFLIELTELNGREKLNGFNVQVLLKM